MTFAEIAAEARTDIYDALGAVATWTPVSGPGDNLPGYFRSPSAASAFGGISVNGDRPAFEVALPADCAQGDQLSIPGHGYFKIVDRKDDAGAGLALLILESL